jgi:hypothetical protein
MTVQILDPLVLAYCAGVIDSDGTIGVKRNTYAMRVTGDADQPTYSERVCVRQVEPHAVDLLKAVFGGRRGISKPSTPNGRLMQEWCVTDAQAAKCLTTLLPHLRIKKAQAENALALREVKEASKIARVARGRGHAGGAPRPAHLSEAMERHYLAAKALNVVGAHA